MVVIFIVGLIKKISLYKMSYFLDAHICSKNSIKVELDLSNYAIKSDLKNVAGVDTSNFAKKSYLSSLKLNIPKNVPNVSDSLKSKVDKLHVDKLIPVLTDLRILSDVVESEVF